MDFAYSENHKDIKNLSAEILNDFSVVDRLKKLEANGAYFDSALWQKLAETGVLSASFPEGLGGMDMDYLASTLVAEAIGRSMVSIPYIPCIVSCALPLLSVQGNKTVSDTLKKVANGEALLTAALIEPGNEDPLRSTVQAKPVGNGWQVSGIKHAVPYAADASSLLVTAQVNGEHWVGLVAKEQAGVRLIAQECTSAEPQYHLTLQQAEAVCVAQGEAAHKLIQKMIAMTTVAYCAMAVGVADKMMRISAEYTSQREQFGVKIATFQAVAHRLADCYIDIECLKIMSLKAACDVNSGDDGADTVSMAKTWCGDVLARVSQAAQHVHGGMGIDRDYHLFRYCLWAKQLELSLGHSKIHRAILADLLEERYLAN